MDGWMDGYVYRGKVKEIHRWAEKVSSQNLGATESVCAVCLLAHHNIRLFITHGGLLSTQEAIHRGVPLLGIPIFGDQSLNMNRAVTEGYGLMIRFNNVTMESLLWGIREMIDNPKYVRWHYSL
jgi:hypothetical protein